jgi:hypothetical protein
VAAAVDAFYPQDTELLFSGTMCGYAAVILISQSLYWALQDFLPATILEPLRTAKPMSSDINDAIEADCNFSLPPKLDISIPLVVDQPSAISAANSDIYRAIIGRLLPVKLQPRNGKQIARDLHHSCSISQMTDHLQMPHSRLRMADPDDEERDRRIAFGNPYQVRSQ